MGAVHTHNPFILIPAIHFCYGEQQFASLELNHHSFAGTQNHDQTSDLLAAIFAFHTSHAQDSLPFDVTAITQFDEPWAMAFLPDGRMLVTEKKGSLQLVGQDGQSFGSIRGVPDVD